MYRVMSIRVVAEDKLHSVCNVVDTDSNIAEDVSADLLMKLPINVIGVTKAGISVLTSAQILATEVTKGYVKGQYCADDIKINGTRLVKFLNKDVEHLDIPYGITIIGTDAFEGCAFKSVTVPTSVKSIESYAFGSCSELQELILPETVSVIGQGLCIDCKKIKRVVLPKRVEKIVTENMFRSCEQLVDVSLPENMTEISRNMFYACKSLVSVDIPQHVVEIDADAFSFCEKLKSITIPDSCSTIGKEAFSHCRNLEKIELGNGVDTIFNNCFAGCKALKRVSLPPKITNLSSYCFQGCSSLVEVDLSRISELDMESAVFSDCSSLEHIDLSMLQSTTLKQSCFYGCTNLKTVILPDTVVEFDSKVFMDCVSLRNIKLPSQLRIIGMSSFEGCSALRTLDLPEGVEKILRGAFAGSGLESITIPKKVDTLAPMLFHDCKQLKKIEVLHCTKVGDSVFSGCENLTDLTVLGNVCDIGINLFVGCSNLHKVVCDYYNDFTTRARNQKLKVEII